MSSLVRAHRAFDPGGQIADPRLRARLEQSIEDFMDLVEASKHYPCIKRAWVEFLGEQPDPVIDPVE